jgi:hypothetical protein
MSAPWPGPDIDEHVYVFHHVPKCGGTSMVEALEAWFDVWWDYRPAWATGEEMESYRRIPLPLDDLGPGTLVCGHFEVGGVTLDERYPQVWRDPRYRVFTFVRAPLACRLSLIRYELDHGRCEPADIEERLLDRANFIQRVLQVDPERLDADLDRFFFVGITEDSAAGFAHLAARLGKPPLALPRTNTTRARDLGISAAVAAEFRRRNAVDLALYARCVIRWQRVKASPPIERAAPYAAAG